MQQQCLSLSLMFPRMAMGIREALPPAPRCTSECSNIAGASTMSPQPEHLQCCGQGGGICETHRGKWWGHMSPVGATMEQDALAPGRGN